MVVRQLAQLLVRRINQFPVVVAEGGTLQSRQTLQVLIAFIVIDINTISALDHHLFDRSEVSGGVDYMAHGESLYK
jgi:hypothetical protein